MCCRLTQAVQRNKLHQNFGNECVTSKTSQDPGLHIFAQGEVESFV